MSDRFRAKVVAVTGATYGIGKVTARRFAAQGADINWTSSAGRYATIHALHALLGLR